MRHDGAAPPYFVIGVETPLGLAYEVRRTHDLAICAYGTPYTTDDGVPGMHILPRRWAKGCGVTAGEFADLMGTDEHGLPVFWLEDRHPGGYFPMPEGPHTDGPV